MTEEIKTDTYWAWLNTFAMILELLTKRAEEKGSQEPIDGGKFIARLRMAERAFNFFLDSFAKAVEDHEHKGVIAYLSSHYGTDGLELWNSLKARRDGIADRVSILIEANPKTVVRFKGYCEGLKNTRNLDALL